MSDARYPSPEAMIADLQPSYPVYCIRPRALAETARNFVERFPGRVLYAVKCNPHAAVLDALYKGGIRHFDTASLVEIAEVRERFSDGEAYFNHPVKARPHIGTAHAVYGVRHYVIDHEAEFAKVLEETGGQDIVVHVRLATPEADVAYHLSAKFGAKPAAAAPLLRAVRDAGLRAGLAFHVGSQCREPAAYTTALAAVGDVLAGSGSEIQFLDVGGGFPATYPGVAVPPLEEYFTAIEAGITSLGLRNDCILMAEPGRALVAECCSLVVQIQLRKDDDQLFINDGIYHSLSEAVTANLRFPMRLIRPGGTPATETAEFTIYGPTCDSTDVLPSKHALPVDAQEGDWIEIRDVGAYSNALATRFNGFHPDTFVEIVDE
jgi:ornithine decarboxylase